MKEKLKLKSIRFIVIGFIILCIVIVFAFVNQDKNESFVENKRHPIDNISQQPGGPDFYEGVCLSLDNIFIPKDKLSINRNDYEYSEGDIDTFNNKLTDLLLKLNSINDKIKVQIRQFEHGADPLSAHTGIFTFENKNAWRNLSDEEKFNYLNNFNEIIIDTVYMNVEKPKYSSLLFYTCDNEYDSDWVAFIGSENGEAVEVNFDWN